MPLDPSAIGLTTPTSVRTWTTADSLLYALAVGAGQEDPLAELHLTTENTADTPQKVVPSFAVVLGFEGGLPDVGTFDPTRGVHAEQEFELRRPLTPEGELEVSTVVVDMWDKGRDALLWTETRLTDPTSGEVVATARTGAFLGGAGGFGGHRGEGRAWEQPEREPDVSVRASTRPDQALLYRLTGDRNPLHSDPAFAARGGFPKPILHGMCTYGFAARLLARECAGGDPDRLVAMKARFSRPVLPGAELELRAWNEGERVLFQVLDGEGNVVIDRGEATLAHA